MMERERIRRNDPKWPISSTNGQSKISGVCVDGFDMDFGLYNLNFRKKELRSSGTVKQCQKKKFGSGDLIMVTR